MIDRFLPVDGLNIHIRKTGVGKKAIVFIHGNSCSAEFWKNQMLDVVLEAHYQLVAIDLPGHGGSDKSVDYSISRLKDLLPAIVDALDLDSYVLAGLSYGTALIAEAAPKMTNCKGFFLASPNITNNDFPPTVYIIPFAELGTMIADHVPPDVLQKFATHLMISEANTELRDQFVKTYLDTDPKFRVDLGLTMQSAGWSDEFRNLIDTGLPVNYLFGEKDRALNIHYMDSIAFPDNHSVYKIPDAAHFVNIDQAAVFNKKLKDFCLIAFNDQG